MSEVCTLEFLGTSQVRVKDSAFHPKGDGSLVYRILGPQVRSSVDTQWCAGETPVRPLPMNLTLRVRMGCQIGSAVVLQKKKEQNDTPFP
jgi:hypothetical protein